MPKICGYAQREFFDSGATLSYTFRRERLQCLKATLKAHEADIISALQNDLHKPELEAYSSELGFVYKEISVALRHLRGWMSPKRVATPLALWPSKSWVQPAPLGVVLTVGPWNYPLHLVMAPLVAAIAAAVASCGASGQIRSIRPVNREGWKQSGRMHGIHSV